MCSLMHQERLESISAKFSVVILVIKCLAESVSICVGVISCDMVDMREIVFWDRRRFWDLVSSFGLGSSGLQRLARQARKASFFNLIHELQGEIFDELASFAGVECFQPLGCGG